MIGLGYIITAASALFLWLFFYGTMVKWLGVFFGFLVAMLFTPGIFIFPLIYKWAEGVWPGQGYFLLFGTFYFGILLSWAGAKLEDY